MNRNLAIGAVLIAILGIALFSIMRRNFAQPTDVTQTESGQTSVTRIMRSNGSSTIPDRMRTPQLARGTGTHRPAQRRAAAPTVKIIGKVRAGHELLWGAKVWLVDSERGVEVGRVLADQSGSYGVKTELTTVPLTIFASFQGFATSGLVIPAGDGSARTVEMDIELRPASFLRGRVVDGNGKPVSAAAAVASTIADPNANVKSMQSWDATTDGDGRFAFEDIPEGPFTLCISHEGFVPAGMPTDAPAPELLVKMESSGASVEGHIFSDVTGRGLEGAKIELTHVIDSEIPGGQQTWKAVSDSMGAFTVSGLPEGKYLVSAEKEKLCLRASDELRGNQLELRSGETTDEVTLHMYPGHTVTGIVTNAFDKSPLAGVRVQTADPPLQSDITDRDGKYRLMGIAPPNGGQWLALVLTKPGYVVDGADGESQAALVKLEQLSSEAKQDFKMHKLITISGRVLTRSGDGIPGADIEVEQNSRDQKSLKTQTDGSYIAECRGGNGVRIKVTAQGFAPGKSEWFDVEQESTSGINLVLLPSILVTGRMVDESGAGLQGQVQATLLDEKERWPAEPAKPAVLTNERGEFSLTDLGAGPYWISGTRAGYSPKAPVRIRLSQGHEQSGVRIQMVKSRFVAGVVVDDAGNPVKGAMVHQPWEEIGSVGCTTREDGKFRFENIGADEVALLVEVPSSMREGDLERGRPQRVKSNRDDVRIVLGRVVKSTLIGKVLDAKTGDPVADFDLSPEQKQYFGDMFSKQGPGVFTLKDLRSGNTFGLWIFAPGYKPYNSGPRNVPTSAELGPDRRAFEEEFRLEPSTSPDDKVSTQPDIVL